MQNEEEIKIKNKALIDKYPFLLPKNVWTGKVIDDYDYTFTEWDCIPDGWQKCFGDMLLEEIAEASNGDIFFEQIKEKYGELRIYCNSNQETQDIISKYSVISRNVCYFCGKPDVGYTKHGWILPICKCCYEKNKYYTRPYEEAINMEDTKIHDNYTYSRYRNGNWETTTVDISDTVNKIREKYNNGLED